MALFTKLRSLGKRDGSNDAPVSPSAHTQERPDGPDTMSVDPEKSLGAGVQESNNDWVKVPEEALPAQDAQQGVQKIEAVTLIWTRTTLALLLIKYVGCIFPNGCTFY